MFEVGIFEVRVFYSTAQLQLHTVCDFLHGTTRFYSVSEVQIHAWFGPTATCGSHSGYKYDHACVAKAVLFHM